MNTDAYRELDRRYLWHPYSRHSAMRDQAFPVIVRGEGVYLYDSDGRRYVDGISSWWACLLGHGHPRLLRALADQAARLQHSILGNLSHPPAIELAARLAALCPDSRRRVFFSGDGASAVEAALKIAVQYWSNLGQPNRCRLVSLENAYHGDTLGAVSVGFLPAFHAPFARLCAPVLRAPAPRCAACPRGLRPADCGGACADGLELLLAARGGEVAAVIVESICQGAAGMRLYAPAFLRRAADACRACGALLIADEIAMGLGRTGRRLAFEHAGVDPDLVCVGKGLAGGYLPISATIVRESVYEAFDDGPRDGTFYHGHTFAGNPLAAAVALETLGVLEDERLVERSREVGERLRRALEPLRAVPGVRDVRGLGLLAAVEFDGEAAGAARAARAARRLIEAGLLLRPLGPVLYIAPPLTIPEAVLDEAAAALRAAAARE